MAGSVRYFRLLFFLLVLCAGGATLLAPSLARQELQEQFRRDRTTLANSAAGQIGRTLTHLSHGLNAVAEGLTETADLPLSEGRLTVLAASFPPNLVVSLYLIDQQGNILVEVPRNHLSRLDLPIHRLYGSGASRTEPQLIAAGPSPLVNLQQPFSLPGGRSYDIGALVSLDQLYQEAFPGSRKLEALGVLFAPTGQLLFHPDRTLIGSTALVEPDQKPELSALLERILQDRAQKSLLVSGRQLKLEPPGDGDQMLLVHAPVEVPGSRWGLALLNPLPEHGAISSAHWLGLAVLLSGLLAGTALFRRGGRAASPELRATQGQEQEQLQAKLAEAERRNRQLLDYAGDALFFVNPKNGRIVDQNRAALALLGYPADELPEVPLSQIFPGSQRHKYMRLVKRVLKSGYAEEGELLIRRRDGEQFTGAIHARLGILDDRQIVHGVLRDISHIKRVEQELRRRNRDLSLANRIASRTASSHNLKEMLQEALALIMDAFKADSGGVYLSRHGGNLLELAVHRGIDHAVLDELSALPPRQGLVGRALASGRPIASANLQRDHRVWSQAVKSSGWKGFQAVPLATGHSSHGVLFISYRKKTLLEREDIQLLLAVGQQLATAISGAELIEALSWQNRLTQASNRELKASRRQLAENLRLQREETRALERLERMKNHFLALASHELRTPLTYVLSGSELMLNGDISLAPKQQERTLKAIHAGGTRLAEIVDNLLEMARLEAQAIYLGQERINLSDLLAALHALLQPDLARRRLSFAIEPLPELDDLFGDQDHLSRAFRRLLENAVKFTPAGGRISLRAERLSEAEVASRRESLEAFCGHFFKRPLAPAYLLLAISDTGIGIDRDEQIRIFEKFYEVGEITEHFTSRSGFGGKGVGLGLALVKGVIEAHAGMIWVSSPGTARGGSTFHLLLPLRKPAEEPAAAARQLAGSA